MLLRRFSHLLAASTRVSDPWVVLVLSSPGLAFSVALATVASQQGRSPFDSLWHLPRCDRPLEAVLGWAAVVFALPALRYAIWTIRKADTNLVLASGIVVVATVAVTSGIRFFVWLVSQ